MTVVLAASLAMPALQWATPFRLPVLPGLPGAALAEAADPQQQIFTSYAPLFAHAVEGTKPALSWLEALYILIGCILLLRLAIGVVLSLRLIGKAAPAPPGWAAGADVRISRHVAAPVTVANVVLLPSDAVRWSQAMRAAVLAHERAHIARWDFAMLVASQINRAVFWFSPLSWWLHRRLAALAELASDDQAMEATGDRPGYAEVLLEMGRRSGPPLRGLAMARPATLTYRIERILSDRLETGAASPVHQMMLGLGAASLSIIAASSRPDPASSTGSAPPLASISPAEQGQPPIPSELVSSPIMHAGQGAPEPLPVWEPQAEMAAQAPPQPLPVALEAWLSSSPTVRGAAQPTWRTTTRNTVSSSPSRSTVQRNRAERDPEAVEVSLKAGAAVPPGSAPRGNDSRGIANSVGGMAGPDGQMPFSQQTGQRPASGPPLLKRADEPYCTGIYVPTPEAPRTGSPVNLVQANYFQASDGTPWLKLALGERTRAKLTGFEVERTSIRTTVVTTLPKGTAHVTGTTRGTYGSIDFECGRPRAHL